MGSVFFCEMFLLLDSVRSMQYWTHCSYVLELPRIGVNWQFGMLIEELHQNGDKHVKRGWD